MSYTAITDVLDFIFEEFNDNHLRSVEIIANQEDRSRMILFYDTPVTDVEYRNRTVDPDKVPIEEIEIKYEDARKAVWDLAENYNRIQNNNPRMSVLVNTIIEYASIARKFKDDAYAESHYISEIVNNED